MLNRLIVWVKELIGFNVSREVLDDVNKDNIWIEPLREVKPLKVVKAKTRNRLKIKRKYNDFR